ncbi:toxin YdaT family protein [Cedecea sp.]|jgi:hypothetical protein|uniref:toxin YdaT family protein n=1 Tax=Cedecea sp. TaxID=1970739 RepID=UPI002F3E6D66
MEEIEKLKNEINAWAADRSQGHVAIEITRAWFQMGGGNGRVRLYPIEDENGLADWKAIYNNRQAIFRHMRGDSKAARTKMQELSSAMLAALPVERRIRIEGGSVNYLVSILFRDVSNMVTAILLKDCGITQNISTVRNTLDVLQQRLLREGYMK